MINLATMAKVSVMVVNAFTFNGEGGNPAGVVLDADQYTAEQKQEIARRGGYNETAFVSKSNQADIKLDFYTPNRQIAHCGHATVATFAYLSALGKVSDGNLTKETVDGNRDIILRDGMAYMEQRPEFYTDLNDGDVERVLQSLSLTSDDLIDGYKPTLSNTGVSYIIVPLKDKNVLKKIKADMDLITKVSDDFDTIGYYAFSMDAFEEDHDLTARMFAPRYNIPEEAATGMGAGTLSTYLFKYMGVRKENMIFERGYFMDTPSKSEIFVNLKIENDALISVMAGGRANVTKIVSIDLED